MYVLKYVYVYVCKTMYIQYCQKVLGEFKINFCMLLSTYQERALPIVNQLMYLASYKTLNLIDNWKCCCLADRQ